uniref:Uncharacterized protein n=1 Tax=Leersia perrieri TaxID=77586 RepID=A0A0D9UX28_9ORYZ
MSRARGLLRRSMRCAPILAGAQVFKLSRLADAPLPCVCRHAAQSSPRLLPTYGLLLPVGEETIRMRKERWRGACRRRAARSVRCACGVRGGSAATVEIGSREVGFPVPSH